MGIQTLSQHITKTPGVLGGKPRVAGRRISVEQIVIWHEWMGRSADDIASEYELTLADVYAALTYYYDHAVEIDESIRASQSFANAIRQQMPSKISHGLK